MRALALPGAKTRAQRAAPPRSRASMAASFSTRARMAPALKSGGKKGVHQLYGKAGAHHAPAQAQGVGVIVHARVFGAEHVRAAACANAVHLVRGDADAHACAAEQKRKAALALHHGVAGGQGDIGVIRRLAGMGCRNRGIQCRALPSGASRPLSAQSRRGRQPAQQVSSCEKHPFHVNIFAGALTGPRGPAFRRVRALACERRR